MKMITLGPTNEMFKALYKLWKPASETNKSQKKQMGFVFIVTVIVLKESPRGLSSGTLWY